MPTTFDFWGRPAIVTGGAKGIGRGIATRLVAAGAKVHVWDLQTFASDGVTSHSCDVTDPASISRALAATVAGEAVIDILINNAGSGAGSKSVFDSDPHQW